MYNNSSNTNISSHFKHPQRSQNNNYIDHNSNSITHTPTTHLLTPLHTTSHNTNYNHKTHTNNTQRSHISRTHTTNYSRNYNNGKHINSSNKNKNTLSAVQCNLGRGFAALNELIHYINKNNTQIIFINEPYLGSDNKIKAIPGYHMYQFPKDKITKACIAIKNNMGSTLGLTEYSNGNICAIQLTTNNNKKLILTSAYIEPKTDDNNTLHKLEHLLNNTANSIHILAGDFNGRHPLWGSTVTNTRGNKIADLLTSYGLAINNTGFEHTYETLANDSIRGSIVDITASSDIIANNITNWKVDKSICLSSDHHAITFNIEFVNTHVVKNIKQSTFRYNTNNYNNWDNLRNKFALHIKETNILETNIENLNRTEISNYINTITKFITKICNKYIPRSKGYKSRPHWWNNELEEAKQKVLKNHRLLHKLINKNQPIHEAISTRDQLKKEYAELIRTTSTNSFREFCTTQGKDDVWSITNKLLKQASPRKPPDTIQIAPNTYTETTLETANAFLNQFYPDDPADTLPIHITTRQFSDRYPSTKDDPKFTKDEVLQILKNMNPNKSPGQDHLTSDICYHFTAEFPVIITRLFNRTLAISYFPNQWKHAVVKIIPKPNKTDYSTTSSFRPIGLIDIFGKTLEKLLINRLNHHIFINNFSNKKQYGFKPQCSSTTALHDLLTDIKELKLQKQQIILISLDIKSAFDNAWWPAILKRLHQLQCPKNIYNLLHNYLEDRTVSLTIADSTAIKDISRGCIQGSVCGPTLWNILLDELFEHQLPNGCRLQAFADDVTLIAHHSNTTTLQNITNISLKIIHDWGNLVKLTFGPQKTQMITFSPKTKKAMISIDNNPIQFQDHIKILGLTIDHKLTFIKHTQLTIDRTRKLYNKLIKYVRPTWGIQSDNIEIIYRMVIEPTLSYASSLWKPALKYKHIINKLLSLQRGFAIKIIRGFRTINTVNAITLAGLTPLHIKLNELADIELTRLTGLTQYLPDDITMERPTPPSDLIHPANRTIYTYTDVSNSDELESVLHTNAIHIYTDGSRHDNTVGAAYVVMSAANDTQKVKKLKLHSACSVFQAELVAIQHALLYTSNNHSKPVHLYSDSKSSLDEICNPNSVNSIVTNIHKTLSKYHIKPKLFWIKAHIGIIGNELADQAAKQAASSHVSPTYSHFPLSFVKKMAKSHSITKSAELYTNNTKGQITKAWCPNAESIKQLLKHTHHSFALTQVLTGHGYHKSYLYKYKITNDPNCPCDNIEEQTIPHLLTECPRFNSSRTSHENICKYFNKNPYHLPDILTKEATWKSFMEHINNIVNNLKKFNNT